MNGEHPDGVRSVPQDQEEGESLESLDEKKRLLVEAAQEGFEDSVATTDDDYDPSKLIGPSASHGPPHRVRR